MPDMAQTVFSSNEQLNFASHMNLDDSSLSSDAGDILIRSTRIIFPETIHVRDLGSTISNKPGNVQITANKQQITGPTQHGSDEVQKSKLSKKGEHVHVPPALRTKPPSCSPSAPVSTVPCLTGGSKVIKPSAETRKNKQPHKDGKGTQQSSAQMKPGADEGSEVVISHYAAGGKGAMMAALKQRCQSAPLRREVKVQLLRQRSAVQSPEGQNGTVFGDQGPGQMLDTQPGPLPSRDQGPQSYKPQHGAPLSGDHEASAACTAAVVTAATIAATAPLLKAQSDMELRVFQMSEGLKRLLEADRRPGQSLEGRAGRDASGSRREESRTLDRVAQLEQQLSSLTQQRLQHLELIQNQQMGLQNRLLESALSVVTGHVSVPAARLLTPDPTPVLAAGLPPGPSGSQALGRSQTHLTVVDLSTGTAQPSQRTGAGEGKSPPETPAPRSVIPKPSHWNSNPQDTHNPQSSSQSCSNLPTRTQRTTHTGSRNHAGPGTIRTPTRPGPAKHTVGSTPKRRSSTAPGSGRVPEAIHDDRLSGSRASRTGAKSAAVAMATPRDGDGPAEQFRDTHQQHQTFRVSTATPGQPSSSANHGDSSAAQTANRMLKDLGRLKAELHTLLTTGEAFPGQISRDAAHPSSGSPSSTSRPPAPHIPAAPAATLPPPAVSVPSQNAAVEVIPQSVPSLPLPGPLLQRNPPSVPPLPRPPLLQRNPPVPSMFEDAEKVLRQVQRNKKVLEENLQAMLRAKEGEVLHCQLEALANNRDTIEEVRVKKTVDAWIKALSKDIQTETAGEELAALCRLREREAAAPTAAQKKTTGTAVERGKDGLRTAGTKSSGRLPRGQAGRTEEKTKHPHPGAKLRVTQHMQPQARVVMEEERPGDASAGEDYLLKLYGKALYEGHRRTLKKGPYLRFSSPSPRSKGPRPRVVESVRGVKMKSSKTQTNLAPDRTVSSPLPPSTNQPQYIFSPTRGGLTDPMEGYLLPIAIPLGRRRVDGMAPQPSRVIISDRPIVVTTSLPPSPPRPAPAPRKPTVTLLEVKSDQRRPSKLTVQVQPSVNIEPSASATLIGPPSPPPQVQAVEETLERRKREEEEEKEENVFPGPNFLAVVDISQETEEDSEVLDGESHAAQSEERSDASDMVEEDTSAPVVSEVIRQYIHEALTEIVSQMLDQREGQTQAQERPAPSTPTQEPPPPQQEDLVPTPMPTPEASSSPVMPSPERSPLGTPEPSDRGSPDLTPRDVQPAQPQQSTPTEIEPEPEPVVTPASTPAPTPPTLTPRLSLEPPSQRNHPWGDAELPLAEEQPDNSLEMNTRPLVMSVAVEEPLLVSPPISVPSVPPPQPAHSPTPPASPLPGPATPPTAPSSSSTEESSSSSSSTMSRTDAAVKHISEGELLFSYNKLIAAQAYEEGLCLPCDVSSFSSSLHEVQDMDYDPPSEGQVRRPQMLPHHDPLLPLLARMDQGVVSTHTGALTRPEGSWGLEADAEEEGSVGEVSEGQRPRLTLAGERILTGHSLLGPRTQTTGSRRHHPLRTTDPSSGAEARTTRSTETQQGRGSSPGQLSQSAELTELGLADTHQGPVTIADLEVEPVMPSRTSHFHSPPPQTQDSAPLEAQAADWFSVSMDRPGPILVRPRAQETHSGEEAQGGSRVMAVHLPSAGLEEEQEEVEEEQEEVEEEASISLGAPGGADSNSSGNDVF